MAYSFIACEDGVDTVALQQEHPELFNVKVIEDGGESWTLRPEVRAALRLPFETAWRTWEAARLKFEETQDENDKAEAFKAALALKAVLEGRGGRSNQ